MSDTTQAPSLEVEASADAERRGSVDLTDPQNPVVDTSDDTGATVHFNPDGTVAEAETAEPDAGGDAAPEGDEQPAETGEAAADALPDYDPANAESVRAYEDRVFSFDAEGKGSLNMGALETLWEGNNGSLPDGVYAYLTDATGISKEAVKEIEAGRVALRERAEAELHAPFGGSEGFEAAFKWATEGGGYTADQKARFNAAFAAKDPVAIREAYELLNTRHAAATKAPSQPERRRASPSRVASTEASARPSGPEPYADARAYQADARKLGANNPEVRKRLEASTFWRSK